MSRSISLSNPEAHESSDEDYPSDDNSKASGCHSTRVWNKLSVEGCGLVDLPLTENTAKSIINVCHQAPFGKGSETIVNESVRKTWELDPTNFKFHNPDWQPGVQSNARTAAHKLGYAEGASARAELYKLLLYEEGAMFKAHQDTEKSDGMFGTLVISQPSEHKGGDIKM